MRIHADPDPQPWNKVLTFKVTYAENLLIEANVSLIIFIMGAAFWFSRHLNSVHCTVMLDPVIQYTHTNPILVRRTHLKRTLLRYLAL